MKQFNVLKTSRRGSAAVLVLGFNFLLLTMASSGIRYLSEEEIVDGEVVEYEDDL